MLLNIKKPKKQCTTVVNKMIGVILWKKPDVQAEKADATFGSSDFTPGTKVGSWDSLQLYDAKSQVSAHKWKNKDVCNCVLSCLISKKLQKKV